VLGCVHKQGVAPTELKTYNIRWMSSTVRTQSGMHQASLKDVSFIALSCGTTVSCDEGTSCQNFICNPAGVSSAHHAACTFYGYIPNFVASSIIAEHMHPG
jgi:hypothetical protein